MGQLSKHTNIHYPYTQTFPYAHRQSPSPPPMLCVRVKMVDRDKNSNLFISPPGGSEESVCSGKGVGGGLVGLGELRSLNAVKILAAGTL